MMCSDCQLCDTLREHGGVYYLCLVMGEWTTSNNRCYCEAERDIQLIQLAKELAESDVNELPF